ncbi:putative trafficking protein particle complex subunit [Helianthus annuus]|nr:putative trafficking protein particle complex subunit [Helianthus annuus]
MAAIYSLYIINKSGGLIFYKDYGLQGRMDTNDSLRLASLWHSMHAISQQLSPIQGCSGIELLEADTFDLHCFQSLTGMYVYIFFIQIHSIIFHVRRGNCALGDGAGAHSGEIPIFLIVLGQIL